MYPNKTDAIAQLPSSSKGLGFQISKQLVKFSQQFPLKKLHGLTIPHQFSVVSFHPGGLLLLKLDTILSVVWAKSVLM